MRLRIFTDIDPGRILKSRGLGESDAARRFIAETAAALCDPYVPFDPGGGAHMKDGVAIAADGKTLTYPGPYAHYQHKGELMLSAASKSAWAKSGETKKYSGRALSYQGAPMRGKEWEKRMLADRGAELSGAVAARVGGKAK